MRLVVTTPRLGQQWWLPAPKTLVQVCCCPPPHAGELSLHSGVLFLANQALTFLKVYEKFPLF